MRSSIVGIAHNRPLAPGQPDWESSADVLVQVEAIEGALMELGHQAVRLPLDRDAGDFIARLRDCRAGVVVNLCESVDDDPMLIGHPAALLELLGVPFTGSSSLALAMSTDKLLAKRLFKAANLRTPAYFCYDGGPVPRPLGLNPPLILKPRFQDASIGIDQDSVITSTRGLAEKLRDFHGRYGPLLVEEYLPGREFNVSLFGYPLPRILPVAEIDFADFPAGLFPIVGYRAKWDSSAPEYHTTRRVFPGHLPPSLLWSIRQVAKECFDLFGLRDYGRVDLRVDERGRPCVLEVNANPCLSPDAGFPAAVSQTGMSYRDMVRDLLHFCGKRGES